MVKKRDRVEEPIAFVCPYCGGRVSATIQPRALMHTLPLCRRFRDWDPEHFLVEANRRACSLVS